MILRRATITYALEGYDIYQIQISKKKNLNNFPNGPVCPGLSRFMGSAQSPAKNAISIPARKCVSPEA